jgi:hypothetical protein
MGKNSWDPIIRYIKDQHSNYLRKELTAIRDRFIQDTRIHCCLYFVNPTGHGLRPVDVIVMKKLSEVVNVVPVIAKADSLTTEERLRFKAKVRQDGAVRMLLTPRQIREELVYHNIRLYPFDTDEDDQEEVQLNATIRVGNCCVSVQKFADVFRTLFLLLLLVLRTTSSSTDDLFVGVRIAGVLSMWRTQTTASLCTCATF